MNRIISYLLIIISIINLINIVEEIRIIDNNEEIIEIERNENTNKFNEDWDKLNSINKDLYAILEFDDNFIKEPVVKGRDNKEYLDKNFNKEKSTQGTLFLDCNYDNDQIKIIYGHNVYYDKEAKFSKLEDLCKQDIFDENRIIRLVYKDKIEKYMTIGALIIDVRNENFKYNILNISDSVMFNKWKKYIEENNLIKTMDKIEYTDNILILQTCKKWSNFERILIFSKQIQ